MLLFVETFVVLEVGGGLSEVLQIPDLFLGEVGSKIQSIVLH